jgi:CheY-like chemotaxis protein
MTENGMVPSVLLMDDEPEKDIVANAIELLREQFEVDVCRTMEEAVEAYYRKFYHVFVLDIDMGEEGRRSGQRGVDVLQHFTALHNQTRVILFSAAGTVEDWARAANAHCFAYVHKSDEDCLGKAGDIYLLEKVEEAVASLAGLPVEASWFRSESAPRPVLFCGDTERYGDQVREAVHRALGPDCAVVERPLAEALQVDPAAFGAIVVLKKAFATTLSEQERMRHLLGSAPHPHVIAGCVMENELLSSILCLVNLHPFRLLDLAQSHWTDDLQRGLQQAARWHGMQEIFTAPPGSLQRLEVILPHLPSTTGDHES